MRWIVGIDEVGRGALAGPVVVAAALVPASKRAIANYTLGTLKDSKKLTPAMREAWFKYFKNHPHMGFALARVYPRGIEKMNISKAANLAALRAFKRLIKERNLSPDTPVFLDGGLYLGNGKARLTHAKTVIKGDETIHAVAAASIAAKVARDRFMRRLAKAHPAYGFDVHKGYGTLAHRKALRKAGPCAAHRLTFLAPQYRI